MFSPPQPIENSGEFLLLRTDRYFTENSRWVPLLGVPFTRNHANRRKTIIRLVKCARCVGTFKKVCSHEYPARIVLRYQV